MRSYVTYILLVLGTIGINTIAQKILKQRWNLWLGYGIPAFIVMLFVWDVSTPGIIFQDFSKAYYPAGKQIIENPASLYSFNSGQNCDAGFVNIPIIALLFTPFSFLSQYAAEFSFAVLGILAIVLYYFCLEASAGIYNYEKAILLGLIMMNGPIIYSIKIGNSTHIVLLLLLATFFCIRVKQAIWLGILLAVASLIKIPLLLLGVYFALRRKWKVVLGFGAALCAIVGTSFFLFGFNLHAVWYQECVLAYAGAPVSAHNVQSIDGFLIRLLTNNSITDWEPVEVGWKFKIIRYALISLLVGSTIWVCWRSKPPITLEEKNLELSIVLCLALVITPISWTHYYLLLLLPLALYLGNRLAVPRGRLWAGSILLSTLLISLPVIVPASANPILNLLIVKLLVSHCFFGGVLLLGTLLAARWQTAKRDRLSPQNIEEYEII